MRYFETHNGNYISTFGVADFGGETITEERYSALTEAVQNAPEDTETIGHRLKTDLTWEEYEIEPVTNPDISDGEAFEIIFGGTT